MFTLASVHGTRLCQDEQSGKVLAVPAEEAAGMPALLLYKPSSPDPIAFLLTEISGETPFAISGAPLGYGIMPIRVQDGPASRQVAICLPNTSVVLTCAPTGAAKPENTVAFAREEIQDWEAFLLEPVDIVNDYPDLYPTLIALQHHASCELTAASVLAQLRAGIDPGRAAAFNAVAQLLPADQLPLLGEALLADPALIERLAATFPDDVFANTSLPALQRWLQDRSGPTPAMIGQDLDALAKLGIDDCCVSFPHLCNAAARRQVQPSKAVCLVATARNEGLYLLEWVAYHRAIGVGDIFIYSNNNDDGSDEILRILAEAGAIHWIQSEVAVSTPAQAKAYGHAFGLLPHTLDSRWTLVIDLDEFFAFDAGRFATIGDYLAWQEARPVDAVALNWLVFGSSASGRWYDAPLTRRFIKRMPWVDTHIKTAVRSNLPIHARPHHPAYLDRRAVLTRNATGARQQAGEGPSFSAEPTDAGAWINHYFLKSTAEFVMKFSRNRGDHPMRPGVDPMQIEPAFADMFIKQHANPSMAMDRRIWACAPDLIGEIGALAALPGMQQAQEQVRQFSTDLMADLITQLRRNTPSADAASKLTLQLAKLL